MRDINSNNQTHDELSTGTPFYRSLSQKPRSTTFVGKESFRLTNTFKRAISTFNPAENLRKGADPLMIPMPQLTEPTNTTYQTLNTEASGDSEKSKKKKNTLKIRRKKLRASNQVLWSVLRFSLPVIWKLGGRTNLILFMIFNVLEKVFVYLTPFALKYTINNVTSDSYPLRIGSLVISDFNTLATLFALTLLLSQVFDDLTSYHRLKAVQIARPLILEISLEHLSWMKVQFFQDLNTQALTNLLESGLNAFSDITSTMLYFISPVAKFLITFILFASIFQWQIIVLCVISVAIYLQIMLASMLNKVNSYNQKSGRYDQYLGRLTQYVDKIFLARIFGSQEHEIKRVFDRRILYEKAILKDLQVSGKIHALGSVVLIIFLMAFMSVTRSEIKNDQQSIGDFTVIITQLSLLYVPMKTIVIDVLQLKQSREDAYALFQLLLNNDKECPVYQVKRVEYIPVSKQECQDSMRRKTVFKKNYTRVSKNTFIITGEIQFENVTMETKDYLNFIYGRAYSKRKIQILSNLSFKLQQGRSFGIVGGPGSGKSTIWKVLARIFELSEGVIKIGGVDISLVDREELRKKIAIVPQEIPTIRQNLRYNIGYGGIGDGIEIRDNFPKLQEAVNQSLFFEKLKERKDFKTHKVVKRYKKFRKQKRVNKKSGKKKKEYRRIEEEVELDDEQSPLWKFKLGSNINKLSPGQVTVMGVARALMKREALVYVFDDLRTDPNYLNELISMLKIEKPEATFLVFSQSVLQIKECDEVIVIDKGELAEMGSHEELFKNEGPYFNMWMKQLKLSELQEERTASAINGSFESTKIKPEPGSYQDTCHINPVQIFMQIRQQRMTKVGPHKSEETVNEDEYENGVEEVLQEENDEEENE